jgi:capsular exopolysaccharide synthesis family protein
MLKSRSLAAGVIRSLGLDKNPYIVGAKPRFSLMGWLGSFFSAPKKSDSRVRAEIMGVKPQLIDKYLSMLTIRPGFETRLVSIAFSTPDPVLAANVANAHVQAFIRQGFQLRNQSSEVAQRFLEGKLDELEKRVEKSEADLNDYRRQRGIMSFSLNDKDQMASERIGALNRAMVQAEASRIALEADVRTINDNDYDSLPAVVSNPLIQSLKVASSQIEGRYANLANQATPDYPPLAQLRAQLLEVRKRQQQEIKRVVSSTKSKYASALERENQLRQELEREKANVMAQKDASLRDVVLAREVDSNRALYQSVLERIKTLGVASAAQVTNVSIVDTAETPLGPSSPRMRLSFILSGFLGLLLGLGLAFMVDSSDNSLKSADEVQSYLRLPSLATVLHFSDEKGPGIPGREVPLLRWAGDKEGQAMTNGAVGRPPTPRLFSAASEAYRAVRTAILLSRAQRPPKTILFSSAMAGEGKSVTAVNTAIAFAQLVNRTLLIDADLRRPRCHELLDQQNQPGLAEVLAGLHELHEVIQPTRVKGLYLLTAGLIPPNPSELLGSMRMRELLASLSTTYDHVLIDTAPILPVSDSVILSTLVDGVVIVSGAQTAKQLVRDACSRLIHVSARILGVVLNNANPELQRYYAPYLYH